MSDWLNAIFGDDLSPFATLLLLLLLVLAILSIAFWIMRAIGGGKFTALRGRDMRLSVIEAASIDGRRRIVLVRRDDVEHLVMIGGPNDLVIEHAIAPAENTARRPVETPVVARQKPAPESATETQPEAPAPQPPERAATPASRPPQRPAEAEQTRVAAAQKSQTVAQKTTQPMQTIDARPAAVGTMAALPAAALATRPDGTVTDADEPRDSTPPIPPVPAPPATPSAPVKDSEAEPDPINTDSALGSEFDDLDFADDEISAALEAELSADSAPSPLPERNEAAESEQPANEPLLEDDMERILSELNTRR